MKFKHQVKAEDIQDAMDRLREARDRVNLIGSQESCGIMYELSEVIGMLSFYRDCLPGQEE